MLGLVGFEVGRADDGADGGDVGAWIGKVGAAGLYELGFQLGFTAHQELLHFFGGFVFVIFPQIAITAGHGDFSRIGGNFFLDQFVILVLAPLQTFPGNN